MPLPTSVLFIVPDLGFSGSTERLRCCVRSLTEAGSRVTVASAGGCRIDDLEAAGGEMVRWEGSVPAWRLPFVAGRMRRLARSVRAQVIYVLGAELAPLGARIGRPYVLELTGPVHSTLPHHSQRLSAVVLPCGTLEEGAVNRGALPRDLMQVLPHHPDVPKRAAPALNREGEVRVGCAGGLSATSGVEVYLAAVRKLVQRGESAHFIVLGQGPAESIVRRCALDLGLSERVVFAAPAAPSTAEILNEIDIFVDPRTAGSPGWLTHEALALGIPSVVSAVQGSFGLVEDQEDALLVPRNEPGALAGELSDLLGDREWARKIGTRARKRARARAESRPSWESLFESLAGVQGSEASLAR